MIRAVSSCGSLAPRTLATSTAQRVSATTRSPALQCLHHQSHRERILLHPALGYHTLPHGPFSYRKDDDYSERRRMQHLQSMTIRDYHGTQPVDRSGVAIVLALGSVAAAAKGAQLTLRAYEEWKNAQPEPPKVESTQKSEASGEKKGDEKKKESTSGAAEGGKQRENIFARIFNVGVGSKYYEGGFEDKMTRREAALILGVRESSNPRRIKEAHRKLLILNHPDTGGSTYLSGKINEAKELLLKGRRDI